MKKFILFSTVFTLFIGKVLSNCFAEEYGLSCCSKADTKVILIDASGKWGKEDNKLCGIQDNDSSNTTTTTTSRVTLTTKRVITTTSSTTIINTTTTTATATTNNSTPSNNDNSCWSLIKFDFPCCTNPNTEVKRIDSNGIWGIENGGWCGLPKDTKYERKSNECWALIHGFSCCKNKDLPVYSFDEFGAWSVEGGEWCGLYSLENNPCWSVKLGYSCCNASDVNVYYDDGTYRWGLKPDGEYCGITGYFPDYFTWKEPTDLPALRGAALKAKQYMNKLNVVDSLTTKFDYIADGVKKEVVEYYSKYSKTNRKLNIIFPPNYSEDKLYPVLYLLHSDTGNENTLIEEIANGVRSIPAELAKQHKAKEMIIVVPKVNVYPPGVKEPPALLTTEYLSGFDNFIYELIDSIMPFIEENYQVLVGRENTAIAGHSMGGRTALYIGYSRPDKFGYVGGFSPAFGITPVEGSNVHTGLFPSEEAFKIKNINYTPMVTLISWGDKDDSVNPYPELYHRILTENNQPHISIEIKGASHDYKAFSTGLYNFILTLFGQLNE